MTPLILLAEHQAHEIVSQVFMLGFGIDDISRIQSQNGRLIAFTVGDGRHHEIVMIQFCKVFTDTFDLAGGIIGVKDYLWLDLPDADQSVPFEPFTIRGIALAWSDRPNLRLDVEAWKERKRNAIGKHASQLDTNTWEQFCSYDDWRGAREGGTSGGGYAESFKIMDLRLLHCMPEAGRY